MKIKKENELINKRLYKIFLGLIKYTPIIIAINQIIGTILNYFGISSILITCFGGSSIIFLIILFLISYIFKFCYLFRLPLIYSTIIVLLKFMDGLIVLPIITIIMFQIIAIITGIFIVLFIYYVYKNRNNPQPDPILELCKKYCNINCGCTQEV